MAARSARVDDVQKEDWVVCRDVRCSDCVVGSGSDGVADLFRTDVALERPAEAGLEKPAGKRRVAARSFLASRLPIEGREDGIEEKEDLVVEEGIVMV